MRTAEEEDASERKELLDILRLIDIEISISTQLFEALRTDGQAAWIVHLRSVFVATKVVKKALASCALSTNKTAPLPKRQKGGFYGIIAR